MTDIKNLNENDRKLIEGMAKNMGISIEQLVATYEDPAKLVENIKAGTYKVLKES